MAARPTPGWRDVALPAALAALGVLELALTAPAGWPAAAALEVLACTLLVFRRRLPLLVAPLAVAVLFAIPFLGPGLDEASAPIGVIVLPASCTTSLAHALKRDRRADRRTRATS